MAARSTSAARQSPTAWCSRHPDTAPGAASEGTFSSHSASRDHRDSGGNGLTTLSPFLRSSLLTRFLRPLPWLVCQIGTALSLVRRDRDRHRRPDAPFTLHANRASVELP